MIKQAIMLGAIAAIGATSLMSTSTPAEAGRKRCVFMAHNPVTGYMIADGWAKAYKKSKACDRARRRCNRELDRKRRKGKVGRGVICRRITNL